MPVASRLVVAKLDDASVAFMKVFVESKKIQPGED